MVQIGVGWGGQSQCSEADVVECFVVDAVRRVAIFHQLMNRQGCVVRFENYIRHLERGLGARKTD